MERAYTSDAALGRNFFRHPPGVLALIAEGLRRKAALTFRAVAAMEAEAPRVAVPAAGAR